VSRPSDPVDLRAIETETERDQILKLEERLGKTTLAGDMVRLQDALDDLGWAIVGALFPRYRRK
jgi:hypothetical protein